MKTAPKKTPCSQTATRLAVLEEKHQLLLTRFNALNALFTLVQEEVSEMHTGTQLRLDAPKSGGPREAVPEAPGNTPIEAATGRPIHRGFR